LFADSAHAAVRHKTKPAIHATTKTPRKAARKISGNDNARALFSAVKFPSAQPTRSISNSPDAGCIAGAAGLPADGEHFQVMRPSRNRHWGHPNLIAYINSFSNRAAKNGWRGLLVGDMGMPRGGPMPTGHASHQAGIDVDIWDLEMPDHKLTDEERENMSAPSMLKPGTNQLDMSVWDEKHAQFVRDAAQDPAVARIFVAPAIKKYLCDRKDPHGKDTEWLRRIRPWWGHDDHIHVRLKCPKGEACTEQAPPPDGDGCGQELDDWLAKTAANPSFRGEEVDAGQAEPQDKPPFPMKDLPAACMGVLTAPDKK
jgi:penicillin-insensitive murein endopeptidase